MSCNNYGSILTHVFRFYSEKVTKKGKPQGSEFTIFASFVLVDCSMVNSAIIQKELKTQFIVCSIGTGTKCIGHDLIEKDAENGFLLHDCHAEVMARRGFVKFLYSLMESGKCSLFFDWIEEEKRWKLKNNFEVHMILTELPCGDCSIVSSNKEETQLARDQTLNEYNSDPISKNTTEVNEMKRKLDETIYSQQSEPKIKKKKLILEGRTGSKMIHNDSCTHEKIGQDQSINVVRLKPGGGSRNQSMSCSDKITKWNLVGIQGSLLSNFFEPIFINRYLILLSENSKLDLGIIQQRLNQSIVCRVDQLASNTPSFHLFKEGDPNIPYFVDRASANKIKGSGYSIGSYLKVNDHQTTPFSYGEEIVIGMKGHKQGITKKDENSPKSASQLSKYMLFKSFINCTKEFNEELAKVLDHKEHNMQTYHEVKKRESTYVTKLNSMKSKSPFDKWIEKKL